MIRSRLSNLFLPLFAVLAACSNESAGADTASDTASDAPPHFLAAYGNGATIDILELDSSDGTVTNVGEWPAIVGYNGFPIVFDHALVTLGVETPQTVDSPFLSSLDPREFSTEQHPHIPDNRVADFIAFDGVLYGVIGTGTAIDVAALNLTTGAATIVGTVADMALYSPRTVIFVSEVCALGETAAAPGAQALFCFDPADPTAATHVALSGPVSAIYAVGERLIAVLGTGTQIELHEIDRNTGVVTLLGTVPNLFDMYAPSPSGVGEAIYVLGRPTAAAAVALYRIPIDDIPATSSMPITQDPGDLLPYSY